LRLALPPRHGGKRTLLGNVDKYAQLLKIPLHAGFQPIFRTDR
jgi:hypothetical protein